MQLVAKALVSGLISVVIAVAASLPGASAGVAIQAGAFDRNVCVLIASAAATEALSGSPTTISVFSPSQMEVVVAGSEVSCTSEGVGYSCPLPEASLPFSLDLMGEENVTVSDVGGVFEWW